MIFQFYMSCITQEIHYHRKRESSLPDVWFSWTLMPSVLLAPLHLSTYLPISPVACGKDWCCLTLLSFLLTFLSYHFFQARFVIGAAGIPAQALRLQTGGILRNFGLKTSFACWGFFLIHLKFCVIDNERLTYLVFRSV